METINSLLKDEICKMNKGITESQVSLLIIKKEKENAKMSIMLLKRHLLIIKEKILQEVFLYLILGTKIDGIYEKCFIFCG